MKKENIALLIVLVIALGYILYGYFSGPDMNVTVEITEEGFSPENLTVLRGATITWVNKGERLHWPASNYHPLHNYYPEKGGCIGSTFDACKGLAKGESFSFKLNQLGKWPVHDHLYPGLTMMVEVVEDEEDAVKTSFDLKSMTPEKLRTLDYGVQLAFVKEIAASDPASSWEFLKKTFMVDGQVVGNAHEFSHIIGNSLYKKFGLKGVRSCDTTFAYGCMHGVTEAMLSKEGVEKVRYIEEECLKYFPPEINNNYSGCIHGMGHGLMTFEGGDYKKALVDCDRLSFAYRIFCYDGVFMENSTYPDQINFDKNDPWKLCKNLSATYFEPCAKYQSQIFLNSFQNSIEEVGVNCAAGPADVLRETCFQSLGYFIAQTSLGDPNKIFKECSRVKDEDGEATCVMGGAIETIFQRYGNWKASAQNLCSRLPQTKKDVCLSKLVGVVQ